jgi:hypothetical protein
MRKNFSFHSKINSPLSFNIYCSDVLRSFDLSTGANKNAIAFTDILLIRIKRDEVSTINISFKIFLMKHNAIKRVSKISCRFAENLNHVQQYVHAALSYSREHTRMAIA